MLKALANLASLPPNLLRGLVLPEVDVNCVTQEAVGR
jgi:hypothetical protein